MFQTLTPVLVLCNLQDLQLVASRTNCIRSAQYGLPRLAHSIPGVHSCPSERAGGRGGEGPGALRLMLFMCTCTAL